MAAGYPREWLYRKFVSSIDFLKNMLLSFKKIFITILACSMIVPAEAPRNRRRGKKLRAVIQSVSARASSPAESLYRRPASSNDDNLLDGCSGVFPPDVCTDFKAECDQVPALPSAWRVLATVWILGTLQSALDQAERSVRHNIRKHGEQKRLLDKYRLIQKRKKIVEELENAFKALPKPINRDEGGELSVDALNILSRWLTK